MAHGNYYGNYYGASQNLNEHYDHQNPESTGSGSYRIPAHQGSGQRHIAQPGHDPSFSTLSQNDWPIVNNDQDQSGHRHAAEQLQCFLSQNRATPVVQENNRAAAAQIFMNTPNPNITAQAARLGAQSPNHLRSLSSSDRRGSGYSTSQQGNREPAPANQRQTARYSQSSGGQSSSARGVPNPSHQQHGTNVLSSGTATSQWTGPGEHQGRANRPINTDSHSFRPVPPGSISSVPPGDVAYHQIANHSSDQTRTIRPGFEGSMSATHPTGFRSSDSHIHQTPSTVNPHNVYRPPMTAQGSSRAATTHLTSNPPRQASFENPSNGHLANVPRNSIQQSSTGLQGPSNPSAKETPSSNQAKRREKPDPKIGKQSSKSGNQNKQSALAETGEDLPNQEPGDGDDDIRALFAKLRELHAKDPAKLHKYWELERTAASQSKKPAESSAITTGADATSPAAERSAAPTSPTSTKGQRKVKNSAPKSITNESPRVQAEFAGPNTSTTGASRAEPNTIVPRSPAEPAAAPSANKIWPESTQREVTQAILNHLYASSANHKIPFAFRPIRNILDNNPPYNELCNQLSAVGYKFDRTALAKHILFKVPDLRTNLSAAGSTRKELSNTHSQAKSSGAPVSPIATRNEMPSSVIGATMRSPSNNGLNGQSSSTDAAQNLPNGQVATPFRAHVAPMYVYKDGRLVIGADGKPQLRQNAGITKESMARKHAIQDIINLDDDDSDDEEIYVTQVKKPKTLADSSSGALDNQAFPLDPQLADQRPVPGSIFQTPQSLPLTIGTTPSVQIEPPSENDRALWYDKTIIEPIDRKKALRKSHYNPKNIARDVLVATGRHPEMRSLNSHLDVLREKFTGVNSHSDLSTFKWSAVDPGEPTPADVVIRGNDPGQENTDDNDSSLAGPTKIIRRQIINQQTGEVSIVEERVPASDPSRLAAKSNPFAMDHNASNSRTHAYEGNAALRNRANGQSPQKSSNYTAARPAEGSPSTGGTGYSNFRRDAVGPDGQPLPKKRGRPVGWRQAIHGSAAARAAMHYSSQQNASNSPRGPGRPPKNTIANATTKPPSPVYHIYRCKWSKCEAKLHNLDILRRHVFKVHGRPDAQGIYTCLWGECASNGIGRDCGNDYHAFIDHVGKSHIDEVAWELGDGPADGISDAHDTDTNSDAYLSDSRGRQVTPRIEIPLHNPLAISAPGPGSRPGRPANRRLEEKEGEARYIRDTLEQKKRQIGLGMDKGGATLANAKRRMGLVEDENDEAIVDDADL